MATYRDKILVLIDAASEGAVQEMRNLQKQTEEAESGFDRLGKTMGVSGKTLKAGLVAGASAFVGTQLVSFVQDSADAFVQAQDAAAQFARATNATVEEAGKFTSVARTLGLDMNDLIEINAEFAKKIEEQPDLLEQLNVQVAKNADGSVNMTRTLVATIDALGSMEDGLQAAKLAADLFGEEGSKQLAGFYLQGIKVSDLMDRIDFIDQSDQAKAFAASSIELKLAMEQLQIAVGSRVVPVFTQLADVALAVIDFFTTLPGPVVEIGKAAAIAGVGLFAVGKGLAFIKSTMAGNILIAGIEGFANAIGPLLAGDRKGGLAKIGGGLAAIGRAVGPLALLTAGLYAYNDAVASGKEIDAFVRSSDGMTLSLRQQAEEITKTDSAWRTFVIGDGESGIEKTMERIVQRTRDSAEATLDNANATDQQKAAAQAYLDTIGDGTLEQQTANAATAEGEQAARDYTLALEGFNLQATEAADAQRDLNDMISELVTKGDEATVTQEELADAVADAADKQRDQNAVTETSNGLMEAYAASTYEAVDATLALFDKQFAANDAQRRLNDAIVTFNAGGFDSADDKAAALDDVAEAALRQAGAAVAAQEQTDLLNGIYNDGTYYSQLLIDNLKTLAASGVLPPEAQASIEGLIEQLETAQEKGGEGVSVEVGVSGTDEARGEIDVVAEDQDSTVTVTTQFEPGGYNAIKARKDYLQQTVTGKVGIDVSFEPGGYNAVKARLDNISRDRTAYIDVITRYSSTGTPPSQGGGDSASTGSASSAINFIRVQLDGRDLKAVIRDEIGALTPITQAVA